MPTYRKTIKDIAKELNISTSTVSRALSDKWDVNPNTRKAVLDLAEKWDYKPNPISLSLKHNQSMFIGVVVPEFVNSFFPEVIMGIESVLRINGYYVLLCQSNESHEVELANIKALESQMVDGFIISTTGDNNSDYYKRMIDKNIPVVFFNRICSNLEASHVVINDCKWAYEAVCHLIESGYRRIAHFTGPANIDLAIRRKKGYIEALTKNQIEIDESLIIPCGIQMEDGSHGALKILDMENPPNAIFAINDPVAIGAIKAIKSKGLKIPDDIAVVGFTESKMAMIIEPNLTSVMQPTFEMGRIAAELLLEQINNKIVTPKEIMLDAKLNIRESSTRRNKEATS